MFGLDLVRAVAILLVLQVHLGLAVLENCCRHITPTMGILGGLGVELFFVLSGFLIGGLLIDLSARAPTLRSWLIFLVRRWMRTIPLYTLWIAVLLALAAVIGRHREHAFAYLTFTQNLAWPMTDHWFDVSWSLSVEEWFYVLFSTILVGLASIWPRRALPVSCAVFILVPLFLRFVFGDAANAEEGLRKVVIYRLDAIAYGVLAVWLYRRYPSLRMRWHVPLLAAGVAMVVATTLFIDAAAVTLTLYPIGLAMCLPAMIGLRRPQPALESVVYWLSTRSYGLYLIHWTFVEIAIALARRGWAPAPLGIVAMVGGSLLAADLLYRYFERPILRLRPRQNSKASANAKIPLMPVSAGH